MRVFWVLCATACSVDTDADGLRDGEEERLGTDPANPDTDGDGLTDGDEVLRETAPLDSDSDLDGYEDGDEVFEGTDPLDAGSRIYFGGWPYRRDKGGFEDPATSDASVAPVAPGAAAPRLHLVDQFGDTVDLADFAAPDREILVEVGGRGWQSTEMFADWRNGDAPRGFIGDGVAEPLQERLNAGVAVWILVMADGEREVPATHQEVAAWSAQYGDRFPILLDEDHRHRDWLLQEREDAYLSAFALLQDDLSIRHVDADDDSRSQRGFYLFADVF